MCAKKPSIFFHADFFGAGFVGVAGVVGVDVGVAGVVGVDMFSVLLELNSNSFVIVAQFARWEGVLNRLLQPAGREKGRRTDTESRCCYSPPRPQSSCS